MAKVTLVRLESDEQGTFGRVFVEGLSLFSGELPWRENRANISCIPAGVYECRMTYSPRFHRPLYLIEGVPDRSGIRFHAANFMGDPALGLKSELNGCIALGERIGRIDGQKVLLLSRPALRRFEEYLAGEPFTLEIKYG